MSNKWFISIVVSVLFLTSVHVSGVLAGTEPSPFQPEINQLGAVANILSSADFRVVKTMSHPPDPCHPPEPCKGLIGRVNRLEAIDNQVGSADNMVDSMINEVMGFEPSPFRVEDLVPPLVVVREAAQGIVGKIDEYLAISPDTLAPEFAEALAQVSDTAFHLVGTVDDGIELFSGGTRECAEIIDADVCNATDLCF